MEAFRRKTGDRPGAVTSVPIGEAPPPVPRGDTGRPVHFHVLARWESAKPVGLPAAGTAGSGTFYVQSAWWGDAAAASGEGRRPGSRQSEPKHAGRDPATSRLERNDQAAISCDTRRSDPATGRRDILSFSNAERIR